MQVRDAALKIQDEMPKSDVNKEYYTQNMEREVCDTFNYLFSCTKKPYFHAFSVRIDAVM